MPARFQAPRGTFDVLPGDEPARLQVAHSAADILGRAGYGRIETPIFEETELFERSVGAATDVVRKEMFTFEDRGGRSITLRPEGTAPICRAYVEHGMHKLAQPVKLWYLGPYFRYEAPQAGRHRQFHQVGRRGDRIRLAARRRRADRPARRHAERARRRAGSSCGSAAWAPPRAAPPIATSCAPTFGSTSPTSRRTSASASTRTRCAPSTRPTMGPRPSWPRPRRCSSASTTPTRSTSPRSARCSTPRACEYVVEPKLVRGLDYYSADALRVPQRRARRPVAGGGGGRYDRLIEELGGPPTPAMGWAAGIERIVLAVPEAPERPAR